MKRITGSVLTVLVCLHSWTVLAAGDVNNVLLRCVVESIRGNDFGWSSFFPPEEGDVLFLDTSVAEISDAIEFEPVGDPGSVMFRRPLIPISAFMEKRLRKLPPLNDSDSHLVVWEGSEIDWSAPASERSQFAFRLEVGHWSNFAHWHATIQRLGRSSRLGWFLSEMSLRCDAVGDSKFP